ncbi:MAG: glycosyltransferase family 2 protein [Prevotellaceae bacterium]|jgi:glycosyltransferase involved in cell wall biosynthesis|nr:glycosyltransferase family 2 protein [Prevotellaceae bacterium]
MKNIDNNILVSIVIPVHNAEKYLEECLNSIQNQTFTQWECIIVNNGSTDSSLSIIQKFAEKDNRFSYYSISNSGYAKMPRDLAVSYANAKWIFYVDADDYVEVDTLEKIFVRATETDADIVYPRMIFFHDKVSENDLTLPAKEFDMTQIITGKEAVKLTLPEWKIGANGGLIKRKLWCSLTTYQTQENLFLIDEYDTRELQTKAQKIAFADTNYFYRQNLSSLTRQINVKVFEKLITDKLLENLVKKEFSEDLNYIQQVRRYRIDNIISLQNFFLNNWSKIKNKSKALRILYDSYKDTSYKIFQGNHILQKIISTNFFCFEFYLWFKHKKRLYKSIKK